MQDSGSSSFRLRGRMKTRLGEKVLEAFNAYSKEAFEHAKAPFILTQGELWHDWLQKEANNIEFISSGPFQTDKYTTSPRLANRPRYTRDHRIRVNVAASAFGAVGQPALLKRGHSRCRHGHWACSARQGSRILDMCRVYAGVFGREDRVL